MAYSTTPHEIFDSLWRLAQCACDIIENEHPDLVIVLYKSGRTVQLAVETLWAATRHTALPPLLPINLGTEKTKTYFDYAWNYNGITYSEPTETGRLIAWSQQQTTLLALLQQQVTVKLGQTQTPTRILVLDDVIHEGGTSLLVLGLLWTLYPECAASVLAGLPTDWRQVLGWNWLEEHHPAALTALQQKWGVKGELTKESRDRIDEHWPMLVAGIIDDDTSILGWQPLTQATLPHNKLLQEMGNVVLLPLAAALQQRVKAFVLATLQRQGLNAIEPSGREPRKGWPLRVTLTWEEKLWAFAWQQRAVKVAELIPICKVTAEAITAELKRYVEWEMLSLIDESNGARYTIPPKLGAVVCGTLLTQPNHNFTALLWTATPDRHVPLTVEYAYANPAAAGAPILIPVNVPYWPQATLPVYPIQPAAFEDELIAALQQQAWLESEPPSKVMPTDQPAQKRVSAYPQRLINVADLENILYYQHEPTLDFVLDTTQSTATRGAQLAQLAITSVTAETYQAGTDGIRYLATAIQQGIITPLTPDYTRAILRFAGDAPDLDIALVTIAKQKGLC